MTRRDTAVTDYLNTLPEERRESVSALRALILETLPQARETIAYNMPAVKVTDEVLCSYKAQKSYISLYMDVEMVAKHKAGLVDLNCGKSCIRFNRFEQLPQETIQAILRDTAVKHRANA